MVKSVTTSTIRLSFHLTKKYAHGIGVGPAFAFLSADELIKRRMGEGTKNSWETHAH